MGAFNLLSDWIPALSAKGERQLVSPAGIVGWDGFVPADIGWGRPDLRVATYELLIGLLSVACAANDRREWARRLDTPPAKAELEHALERLQPYLWLDGEGPRFLQDLDDLGPYDLPLEPLFIDAISPSVFVKPGRSPALSRPAAAIVLYAMQAFAPPGGRGHRTSMRGGGPLTTLVVPNEATLWQRVWANVLPLNDEERAPDDLSLVFPWARPTRTSEKGETTEVEDVHELQAYFGMPRRFRLAFLENTDRKPCAITGAVDEVIATGLASRHGGTNYGTWQHPLTPYYKPKAGGSESLPVHPKDGRVSYRQWLGYAFGTETASLAKCVTEFQTNVGTSRPHLLTAGWVTSNAKAIDYVEADLPLYVLRDRDLQHWMGEFARNLVTASDLVARVLRDGLRKAFDSNVDKTIVATPVSVFWIETEGAFYRLLDESFEIVATEPSSAFDPQRRAWQRELARAALRCFDRFVPLDRLAELGAAQRKAIIDGRRLIASTINGYGKGGEGLFKALGLPPPETKRKKKGVGNA